MGAKVWTPEETELLFSIRDSATVRQILEQGQDGDKAPRGYLRQAAEAMVRELHPALKKLPIFQGDDAAYQKRVKDIALWKNPDKSSTSGASWEDLQAEFGKVCDVFFVRYRLLT